MFVIFYCLLCVFVVSIKPAELPGRADSQLAAVSHLDFLSSFLLSLQVSFFPFLSYLLSVSFPTPRPLAVLSLL